MNVCLGIIISSRSGSGEAAGGLLLPKSWTAFMWTLAMSSQEPKVAGIPYFARGAHKIPDPISKVLVSFLCALCLREKIRGTLH